jgi:hypothetical protein
MPFFVNKKMGKTQNQKDRLEFPTHTKSMASKCNAQKPKNSNNKFLQKIDKATKKSIFNLN